MTQFFLHPCGDSYIALNEFIQTWRKEHPTCKLLNVDWHCYEGTWYVGVLYKELS
jgi:hypothetical protein